jgi:hypothetical protein
VIEAFPNAFLGVCLDDEIYVAMPKLRRGQTSFGFMTNGSESRLSAACRRDFPSQASVLNDKTKRGCAAESDMLRIRLAESTAVGGRR